MRANLCLRLLLKKLDGRFNIEIFLPHTLMVDFQCTFNGVTLSQPNSFEPQLLVRIDIRYARYPNQPQPQNMQIINAKFKIRAKSTKPQNYEIGIAEQEYFCSVNLGDTSTMNLTLRLSPYLLYRIEELRASGDLIFQFEPLYSGIVIGNESGHTKLESANFQIHSNTWKYPRSEWIDHLNATEFDKMELIEIPKVALPKIPLTDEVMKFLSQANKAMSEGRNDDVLSECRNAIDALDNGLEEWSKNKTLTPEETSKLDVIKSKQNGKRIGSREEGLARLMHDVEKGVRLGLVIGNLHYYLSLSPHEAEHKSHFTVDDAKFVIHSVTSYANDILRHLSNKKE